MFALGSIVPYIVSYFRISLGCDVSNETFEFLLPLVMIITTLWYPIANFLADSVSPRTIIICASVFGLAALYSCALIRMSPYMFIALFAGGLGILKGSIQAACNRAVWSHLPE